MSGSPFPWRAANFYFRPFFFASLGFTVKPHCLSAEEDENHVRLEERRSFCLDVSRDLGNVAAGKDADNEDQIFHGQYRYAILVVRRSLNHCEDHHENDPQNDEDMTISFSTVFSVQMADALPQDVQEQAKYIRQTGQE